MNEIWIKARTDGFPGDGTQSNPFNGSNPDRLDTMLRDLPRNTALRFLPGEYLTRGYHAGEADPLKIWQFKPGWKFIGAGIDITTIRLVDANLATTGYSVIGSEYNANCDYGEITGITVDADLDGQPDAVMAQCVAVFGSHILISRVKGKRFGTRNSLECFALGAYGGHVNVGPKEGNRIEDSFLVEPSENMTAPGTTGFCIAGGATPNTQHRAPTIRRCLVNAGKVANVRGYTMNGVCGGLIEDNVTIGCHHGVYSDSSYNAGLTIKGNRFLEVVAGVDFNYVDRLETRLVETRLDILDNCITVRRGGVAGLNLSGARDVPGGLRNVKEFLRSSSLPPQELDRALLLIEGVTDQGSDTFEFVKIHDNSISAVEAPEGIAGAAVHRAGFVDMQGNVIALPATDRRIRLTRVRAWRLVDQFCA